MTSLFNCWKKNPSMETLPFLFRSPRGSGETILNEISYVLGIVLGVLIVKCLKVERPRLTDVKDTSTIGVFFDGIQCLLCSAFPREEKFMRLVWFLMKNFPTTNTCRREGFNGSSYGQLATSGWFMLARRSTNY